MKPSCIDRRTVKNICSCKKITFTTVDAVTTTSLLMAGPLKKKQKQKQNNKHIFFPLGVGSISQLGCSFREFLPCPDRGVFETHQYRNIIP